MANRSVTESTVVAARPEQVFDLLADPRRHPEIDGSGTVRAAMRGPERLQLGSHFGMRMRIGLPYPIRNTVVEFEENRRIAWRHFGRHVWRYELEPVADGTRVTETFDYSTALSPRALELLHFPQANRKGISATLGRLRDRYAAAQ
jgi:uncharacterized protein YndB with AHSA1/START domain